MVKVLPEPLDGQGGILLPPLQLRPLLRLPTHWNGESVNYRLTKRRNSSFYCFVFLSFGLLLPSSPHLCYRCAVIVSRSLSREFHLTGL